MNIILLGPQGSGKGTQARLLASKFGYTYFDMGEKLREASKNRADIRSLLAAGKLLSDELVVSVFRDFLAKAKNGHGLILDGIPRRLTQYEQIKRILAKIDLAILLMISRKESIRRLSARRTDPKTGVIYNLVTNPPPPGVSEKNLIHRPDDLHEAIEERLRQYDQDTTPLIEVLTKEGILVSVNGERNIEDIHKELVEIVEKKERSSYE